MGTEVPISDIGRRDKRGSRVWNTSDMRICRMRSSGAECTKGSRAFDRDDSTEGIDIVSDGEAQGSDLAEDIQSASGTEEEAVLGESFLVQRVLRGYDWSGCGHDTQVCPLP